MITDMYLWAAADRALAAIRGCNRNRIPTTPEECAAVLTKLGVTVERVPALLSDPVLAGGILILPPSPSIEQTMRWLVHECAEAVLRWEGEPPLATPAECTERHKIASIVERLAMEEVEE